MYVKCVSCSSRKTACYNQFSSVAQSCSTLCDPTDCSLPGFPVHHQLPELAQTHVHRVSDAMLQPTVCKCRCGNTNLFCYHTLKIFEAISSNKMLLINLCPGGPDPARPLPASRSPSGRPGGLARAAGSVGVSGAPGGCSRTRQGKPARVWSVPTAAPPSPLFAFWGICPVRAPALTPPPSHSETLGTVNLGRPGVGPPALWVGVDGNR